MNYVIFNKDGSVKNFYFTEIINQNSDNVNEIFVAVDGMSNDTYVASANFELPDGTINTLTGVVSSLSVDGSGYQGYKFYKFTLTSAQTAIDGNVLCSIALTNTGATQTLYTYQIILTINPTASDPNVEQISVAQYNNLQATLASLQQKFVLNNARFYPNLADAQNDLVNLAPNQRVIVANQDGSTAIYYKAEVAGSDNTFELKLLNSFVPTSRTIAGLSLESDITENALFDRMNIKGRYATLTALQTADPTHGYCYLVEENNHWYYWNGSAWADGGLYLASPENTINSNFLSILYLRNQIIDDLFGEVIENPIEGYYLSYSTGQQVANANYSISDFIQIEENVEYRFITPASPFDLQVCFFDENKDFISGKLIHGNNVTFLNNVAGAKYLRFSYETIYRNATILTENTETIKEKLALCVEELFENVDYDLAENLSPNATIYASGVYWGSKFAVNKGQIIKTIIINTAVTNSGNLYICRKNGNNYEILKSQAFSLANVGENIVHLSSPYVSQYEELYLIISVAGLRYVNSGSTIGMSEFFLDAGGTYFTKGTTISSFGLGAKIKTIYPLSAKVDNLTEPDSSYITVKKDGGDYSSLSQAISNANDGDTIIVFPGVYEDEICDAQTKEIHIIGLDRNTCIIKNNSNAYLTPCLEISKGSVCNLSFIQDKDLDSVITGDYPYAVHIDYDGLANNKLVFENCYFYSKFSASVGVGLRANCQLEFNNCVFETEHNLNSRNVHIGALFVHPSTNANTPSQNLLLDNCSLKSKFGSALAFQYVGGSTSNVYVTLLKNFLWSDETETTNVISYDGSGTNIEITNKTFGNNVNI